MSKMTPEQLKTELKSFYGTEHYYKHPSGMLFTDGVKFLADNAGAYWLIDAIAAHQNDPCVSDNRKLQEMQFWTLKLGDKGKATLTVIPDLGVPPVVTQKLEFTDFPLDSIEIWVQDNVMFLPSEY